MIASTLVLFGFCCLAFLIRWIIFRTRPSDIAIIEDFARKANLRVVAIDRWSLPFWRSVGALARYYRVIAEDSAGMVRKINVAFNFWSDTEHFQVLTDRGDTEIQTSSASGASTPDIRWITYLQWAIASVAICMFFYGLVMYPDAPIGPCGETQFCGKGGTSRSEADFKAFKAWETTMIVTVLISIPSHFLLGRYKRRKNS
jgi:hypothetical protein